MSDPAVLREELEACHQRIGELNAIIMERDKEIERLRADKHVLQYQMDDERNENGVIKQDLDVAVGNLAGRSKRLDQLAERLDEQLAYNAELVEENAALKARVEDRENKVGRLANEIGDLNKIIDGWHVISNLAERDRDDI